MLTTDGFSPRRRGTMRHFTMVLLAMTVMAAGMARAQQTPAADTAQSSGPSTPAAAAASAQPTATRALGANDASTILGREIFDIDGDSVGRLIDVLVSKDGAPLAAVIDVGGFLGVGSRRVAVAWRLLRFAPQDGNPRLMMNLTNDMAAAAPEYRGPDNGFVIFDRRGP